MFFAVFCLPCYQITSCISELGGREGFSSLLPYTQSLFEHLLYWWISGEEFVSEDKFSFSLGLSVFLNWNLHLLLAFKKYLQYWLVFFLRTFMTASILPTLCQSWKDLCLLSSCQGICHFSEFSFLGCLLTSALW